MNPTGQTVEVIRKQFPTRTFSITNDANTTPVIERAGLARMWVQCPAGTLGPVQVLGSLSPTGPFAEPTITEKLTTLGSSNAPIPLPDDYYGLLYLKFVADSGTHTIVVGGAG
jgi:hypothetical protein